MTNWYSLSCLRTILKGTTQSLIDVSPLTSLKTLAGPSNKKHEDIKYLI